MVKVFKWEIDAIKAAITALVYALAEVFVVALGPALVVCFTFVPDAALTCFQYELASGAVWTVGSASQLLQQMANQGVVATGAEFATLLARLPNIGLNAANVVLTMIHGGTGAIFAWRLSKSVTPGRTPRKIAVADIDGLRESVKDYMRGNKLSRDDFAELAGISIGTLAAFLDNSKDSHQSTLDRIRAAIGN